MERTALVIIDIQNDYFPAGAYPQYRAGEVLEQTLALVTIAQQRDWPVILVQHIGGDNAPFFRPGGDGVKLHPSLRWLAEHSQVVVKQHADSFLDTSLRDALDAAHVSQLVLCGMMTQNCVTHTALSPAAHEYHVRVVGEACGAPDAMVHAIALRALADRVTVVSLDDL